MKIQTPVMSIQIDSMSCVPECEGEICDFIHPNKTIMPEDWDKETMMEYWRTQPQNTG